MTTRQRRVAAILIRAVAVVAFGTLAYSGDIDGNLDMIHEGERLAHYDALRDGRLPFRDIYIFHGFGEEVVKPLLACKLYGESVTSLRRLGANAFYYRGPLPALGMAAFALAASLLIRSPWMFGLVIAAACGVMLEMTDRHFFGFMAIAFVGAYIHTRRRSWLVAAGASGVLAALYSLEVGLFALAAMGVWSLLQFRFGDDVPEPINAQPGPMTSGAPGFSRRFLSTASPLALGAVIAALPFVAWCLYHGILDDFIGNCRTQLFEASERKLATYPLPTWPSEAPLTDRMGAFFGPILLFYVPPALIVATLGISLIGPVRDTARLRSAGALIAALAAFFWTSVLRRPDFWHVAYAAGAVLLVVACLWLLLLRHTPRLSLRVPAAALMLLMLAAFITFGQGGLIGRKLFGREFNLIPQRLKRQGQMLTACSLSRVGAAQMAQAGCEYASVMTRLIQRYTPPGDTWLDLTDQGLLYFLTERRCPSRFYYRQHWQFSPRLQEQVVAEIRAQPLLPACVLRLSEDDVHTPVEDLVNQYYKVTGRVGRMQLLTCPDRQAHRATQVTVP